MAKREVFIKPERRNGRIITTSYVADYTSVEDAATVVQAVMDKRFIEEYFGSWVWVSFEGAIDSEGKPLEGDAWYKIDRTTGVLEKISEKEAGELEWYNKLLIDPSALDSIISRMPLTLDMEDGSIQLEGTYWGVGRIAQVGKDFGEEPTHMLRKQ